MNGGGRAADADLEGALRTLKSRGCNLLVLGTLTADVKTKLSRTYLGSPEEDRCRLVVLTGCGRGEPDDYLPVDGTDHDPSRIEVIQSDVRTRSASVATALDAGTPASSVGVDDVVDEVLTAISRFDYDVDALAPGELRVAFDSLMPLFRSAPGDDALRALRTVLFQVRGARGMGHYYLSVDPDSLVAAELRPLFDATIEIKIRQAADPVQKWYVPRFGVESEWMRV